MKRSKNNNSKGREDRKNSPFEDRKRFCPFSQKNGPIVDYKDIKLLSRFISEKGKMTPSRITNVSSKNQKKLSTAIKRARFLALMSYTQKAQY